MHDGTNCKSFVSSLALVASDLNSTLNFPDYLQMNNAPDYDNPKMLISRILALLQFARVESLVLLFLSCLAFGLSFQPHSAKFGPLLFLPVNTSQCF